MGVVDLHGLLDPDSVDVNPIGSTYLRSTTTNTICLGMGDESKLGTHCKIHARPAECSRPDQKGATLLGPATRLAWTCRSCGCNAHNAMCNRHGVTRPEPTKSFEFGIEFVESTLSEVQEEYEKHYTEHRNEWLKKWPEQKRKAIQRSEWLEDVRPDRVKNMVKREHQSSKPKKARCIQFYPNLATQALFGPEFTSLQKAYCKVWKRRGCGDEKVRVTIASMMNSVTLGEWMKEVLADYSDPHFYERDGKAWDATMGRMHHELKMLAYSRMSPEFLEFVESCYHVKGFGLYRGGAVLSYSVEGTTKSGHNDTTLGNCIINAMIAAEACRRLGLTADIIVAGDDLLVIIEGDFDEHALAGEERALGIAPEYRKFDDVEDVSFISGQWITLPGRYIFAPKVGRLLARLHWTVTPPPAKHFDSYLRGVYSGIRATCHSLPVVRLLAPELEKKGKDVVVDSWYTQMYGDVGVDYTYEEVLPWFLRKYHCFEHEIVALETALRDRTPRIVRTPLVDKIEEVDLAEIEDRVCVRN